MDERITSIDLGARREKRSLGMDCGRELRRQLWRAPGPNPIGTIKLSESCVINFFYFGLDLSPDYASFSSSLLKNLTIAILPACCGVLGSGEVGGIFAHSHHFLVL